MVSRVQWRDGRQIFGRAILRDPHRDVLNTFIGFQFTPKLFAVLRATGKRPKLGEARQPGKAAHFTAQERS